MKLLGVFILTCCIVIQLRAQTTVTLYPDKDAVIIDVYQDNNYGTDDGFACARMTNMGVTFTARSLMDFDLSSIPNGAIITSATLTLYGVNHFIADQSTASYLERIVEPWVENQVTWKYQPARSTTASKISLAAAVSTTANFEVNVKEVIQAMIDEPETYHGLMLSMQDEVDPYRRLNFASSDYGNSSLHPKLSITYDAFVVGYSLQHVEPATNTAGSISVSPQYGSSPYTYLWSTGDTVSSIGDLHAGIYTLTVTDNSSKEAHLTFNIRSLVEWDSLVGVTESSGVLTKVASTGWGNAGAYSVDQLAPFTNGALHYEVGSANKEVMISLSEGNTDANYTSLDYAFYLDASYNLHIYESGTNVGSFGSYTAGDKLVIERKNQQILYKKNGVDIRAVDASDAKTFNADVALNTLGEKVDVVYITFGGIRLSNYAVLKKKLDGGYYFTNNNVMRVYYLEEYYHAADTWTFHVYDDENNIVSLSPPTPSTKKSADNWFELNVGSLTGGKYFVLEVINDKNEKSYLRFIRAVSPGFSVVREGLLTE